MNTWIILLLFLIGLILIIKGGDAFVDAASWIARAMNIPTFIIGATIVSLATTLPELFVSGIAASQGKIDMAIGNAIGSVIANTGLIFALSVLCIPSAAKRGGFLPKGVIFLVVILAVWGGSRSGRSAVGSRSRSRTRSRTPRSISPRSRGRRPATTRKQRRSPSSP